MLPPVAAVATAPPAFVVGRPVVELDHHYHNNNNNQRNANATVVANSTSTITTTTSSSMAIPRHVLLLEETSASGSRQPSSSSTHATITTTTKKRRHVPTVPLQQQQQVRQLVLNRSLQHDYLATRYRAFQEMAAFRRHEQQQHNTSITLTPTTTVNATVNHNNTNQQQQQQATSNIHIDNTKNNDPFWNGATPLEKLLVSCCLSKPTTTITDTGGGGSDATNNTADATTGISTHTSSLSSVSPPGVLSRDQMTRFVGLLALHCSSGSSGSSNGHQYSDVVAARALALALLEVTAEMDEHDHDDQQQRLEQYKEQDDDNNDNEKNIENDQEKQGEECADQQEECADMVLSNEEDIIDVVERMSPKHVRPRNEQLPPRISYFIHAGGLKILSRWVRESRTPMDVVPTMAKTVTVNQMTTDTKKQSKKQHPSSSSSTTTKSESVRTQQVASVTGKLLLPLLQFLQRIPFDARTKQFLKEAKLGTEKNQLQAALQSIFDSWKIALDEIPDPIQEAKLQARTHPKSGGLPVWTVLAEVNKLSEIWTQKWKETKKSNAITPEITYKETPAPFGHVLSILHDRLKVLRQYESFDPRIPLAKNATAGADTTTTATGDLTEQQQQQQQQQQHAWLMRVIQKREAKVIKDQNKVSAVANARPLTVQERERLERQKERKNNLEAQHAVLKKNKDKLDEALKRRRIQDAKEQLERKQQIQQAQQQQQLSTRTVSVLKPPRPKVTWKDGLTSVSIVVRKHLLEQVREFTRDADALLMYDNTDDATVNHPTQDDDDDYDDDDSIVILENTPEVQVHHEPGSRLHKRQRLDENVETSYDFDFENNVEDDNDFVHVENDVSGGGGTIDASDMEEQQDFMKEKYIDVEDDENDGRTNCVTNTETRPLCDSSAVTADTSYGNSRLPNDVWSAMSVDQRKAHTKKVNGDMYWEGDKNNSSMKSSSTFVVATNVRNEAGRLPKHVRDTISVEHRQSHNKYMEDDNNDGGTNCVANTETIPVRGGTAVTTDIRHGIGRLPNDVWSTLSIDQRKAYNKMVRGNITMDTGYGIGRLPNDVWSAMSVDQRKAHTKKVNGDIYWEGDKNISGMKISAVVTDVRNGNGRLPKHVWNTMSVEQRQAHNKNVEDDGGSNYATNMETKPMWGSSAVTTDISDGIGRLPSDVWSTLSIDQRKAYNKMVRGNIYGESDKNISGTKSSSISAVATDVGNETGRLPKHVWNAMSFEQRQAHNKKVRDDNACKRPFIVDGLSRSQKKGYKFYDIHDSVREQNTVKKSYTDRTKQQQQQQPPKQKRHDETEMNVETILDDDSLNDEGYVP